MITSQIKRHRSGPPEQVDTAWVMQKLNGATLCINSIFLHGYEVLFCDVINGYFDGAIVAFFPGVLFNVIPKMTCVTIRRTTEHDQQLLSRFFCDRIPITIYDQLLNDPIRDGLVIDSLEGSWYIWAGTIEVRPRDLVDQCPDFIENEWNSRINLDPLWEDGLLLEDLLR